MQRAGRRRCVADLGPVGAGREQRGHDDRNGGNQRGAHAGRGERREARAHACKRIHAGEPVREHEAGEHVKRQQGDLVAADRHQPRERTRRQPRSPRRPLDGSRHQPEDQRQVSEADHLDGVLDARTGGAAEREGQRRHQRPAGMPAAVVKEQDDAEPAEEQVDECHDIEGAQADCRIEGGEHDMQR